MPLLAERISHERDTRNEYIASHRQQHTDDLRALQTATKALEDRLAGLNEFRAQLTDQAKTFSTRTDLERVEIDIRRQMREMAETISKLVESDNRSQGALGIARFLGPAGLLAGLAALVLSIVNRQAG